ncbi:hypothetical protein GY45DRAFT_1030221 [Cubamyces sp. BRFM 1775]|nr:hypothetical protein GY45DRAFT_1030221 [Cubamyces sp. BRFM 1775]
MHDVLLFTADTKRMQLMQMQMIGRARLEELRPKTTWRATAAKRTLASQDLYTRTPAHDHFLSWTPGHGPSIRTSLRFYAKPTARAGWLGWHLTRAYASRLPLRGESVDASARASGLGPTTQAPPAQPRAKLKLSAMAIETDVRGFEASSPGTVPSTAGERQNVGKEASLSRTPTHRRQRAMRGTCVRRR